MSRCFPFPPPGYEKKARTDDVDSLKKEKHREKKHKKEKKDKEKRESTDKSDGKHREKKDKKEKKRDKKKDKEKDRDLVKDKISTSDEKRVPGKTEGHGEERCIQKEYKGNCFDKRYAGQIGGHQAEKLTQYRHLAEQNQNSVLVELGRRSKDEARAFGNYLAEKITESDRKRDDILAEIKEKNKDRRVDDRRTDGQGVRGAAQVSGNTMVDDRRTDGQGVRGAAQVSGNTMVQNLVGMVEPKVEGLSRPLASNVDRKIDGKEKAKEKEGGDKRGEKRKDKDREKKKQGKGKDKDKQKKKEAKAKEKIESKNGEPDKEKKKEEKTKEKNETKNAEPDKLRKSDKEDHIDSHSVVTSQLPKDSNKSAGSDGNLKKRRDIQTNGVVHANDIRPSKLSRPSSSSHSLPVNGRTPEPSQTSIPYVSDRLGAANNLKVDVKDCKINGIIEAPSLAVSTAKPTSTATQAVPVAEACMRPPHPDSRYLSHVYMVPKLDEVPDHDDQDWLFGCSDAQSKRPQVESSRVTETPEVWSEVLRIESADVHALPYVIPY